MDKERLRSIIPMDIWICVGRVDTKSQTNEREQARMRWRHQSWPFFPGREGKGNEMSIGLWLFMGMILHLAHLGTATQNI